METSYRHDLQQKHLDVLECWIGSNIFCLQIYWGHYIVEWFNHIWITRSSYGGTTTQGWIKIEKRAIRAIAASKCNAHTNPIFNQLKLLIVHEFFKLNRLKFYFKYKHNDVPVYFMNYEFRPNDEIHIYPTRHGDIIPANVTRTSQFHKCIRHHLPKLINETPNQTLEKIWTNSFLGFSE